MANDGFTMEAVIEIGLFEGFEKILKKPSIVKKK
jgi:hypothetical protein